MHITYLDVPCHIQHVLHLSSIHQVILQDKTNLIIQHNNRTLMCLSCACTRCSLVRQHNC